MTFDDWWEKNKVAYFWGDGPGLSDLRDIWNAATAAERERCARIVESSTHGEMTVVDGELRLVSDAIRSGK